MKNLRIRPSMPALLTAAALACVSVPSVSEAAKPKKVTGVSSKKSAARALRRVDRKRGHKSHGVADYERLKFLKEAESIHGISMRGPVELGSNAKLKAKHGAKFSKADRKCLDQLDVQLKDTKAGGFAHRCSDDRLLLFVNGGHTDGSGPENQFFLDVVVIVIAGAGMWAAFQETQFQGGVLETTVLCASPGSENMPECQSTDTETGDEDRGDANEGSDDDDSSDSDDED